MPIVTSRTYLQKSFKRLSKSHKAASMVEYALLVALISIVAIGAIRSLGVGIRDTFDFKVVGGFDGTYENVRNLKIAIELSI